jgi:hypothetical protein
MDDVLSINDLTILRENLMVLVNDFDLLLVQNKKLRVQNNKLKNEFECLKQIYHHKSYQSNDKQFVLTNK